MPAKNQRQPQKDSATMNLGATTSSNNNNINNNNNNNTTNATANGGPRVSFNRDVHVKRIGKHPNEATNYETTNLNNSGSYHQLPTDLSEESIRKEAALVLAQAERHKSKAQNPDLPFSFKLRAKRDSQTDPKKFHSLPTRKKKNTKAVTRSVSDAAAKKPSKRPSIFSLFSRKSDTHINQVEPDPRFESSGGRRLVRSKSDVGSEGRIKKPPKELKTQTNGASRPPGTSTPLSPIIEHALKEDYFAEQQHHLERRKSDAITEREKHASALNELLARSENQAETDGNILKSNNNSNKQNIANSIQEKIRQFESKSQENMHSSQLPAQKLPLTKGVTVNGLVKRLSMERFSPPPPFSQPAFSYIRPNEGLNYAQLEMNDERSGTPVRHMRDIRSPERELPVHFTFNGHAHERTDYNTSQHKNYNNKSHHESPMRSRDSFSPTRAVGPTTIRITSSHSPSPWQQLSPRNLSDEDEGLGFETRKYYREEEVLRSKSPTEPPIVPVIRRGHDEYDGRGAYRESPQMDDLGYRRARLESRIATRRFGDSVTNGYHNQNSNSPERNRDMKEESLAHHRYLSPERDIIDKRYHKPQTSEILKKYSPERTHLDIIAPPTSSKHTGTAGVTERRSRYTHTKYLPDGHGGAVKEVYARETTTDAKGVPHVRESRHRERLDSYTRDRNESSPTERLDYEPKSLDSQFTSTDQYRSSPENIKRYHSSANEGSAIPQHHPEHWNNEGSSLKRDKLQQRSFDKGDSGIENDFRKESFNGEISSRWRKRTIADDMRFCENFLRKERRHTEQIHAPPRNKDNYIYRERSIDDGSHYDPHLDKYPVSTSTLRRQKDQKAQNAQIETLKRNKKLGGFEKVKQLFTGGSGGGSGGHSNNKKDTERHSSTSSSTQSPIKDKDKEKYMVKEEEMRTRYREHRSGTSQSSDALREPKAIDISMRRRLSTPKASPLLLKRTSSDKTAKKVSPLASKPEKTSWFKSLDRRSKSKSKEKVIANSQNHSETSSMKRLKSKSAQPKNLRFFGDTDLDSNPPTISKANSLTKSRPSLSSTLSRSQKHSQSAYNLDRITPTHSAQQDYRPGLAKSGSRNRSSSLHNFENERLNDEVDFRKRRHYSRSRELHDISESGSETEEQNKRMPNGTGSRTLSRERLDRAHRYEPEHAYRRSNDRTLPATTANSGPLTDNSTSSTLRRNSRATAGPPKPARSAERRILSPYNRNNDRYPAESSGTEGESSLHSQRSVVYLHATTVGAIPQPYHMRRRSISRDDLRPTSKGKPQPLQPMTRTVSRSVSMLAPWKPKHISEGYEINYSQEQNKQLTTMPRAPNNAKKSDARNRRQDLLKDDQSSLRNSSTTSASKSALSTNRRKIK